MSRLYSCLVRLLVCCRKWENAIANNMGPDSLEMWFNFIGWYEQNVQYESQSLFETALGKCLATYECDSRYNQDVRMIKLWMKYVSIDGVEVV